MKRGNIFKNVLSSNPSSNVFDLSHDVKLSFNMGDLVPVSIMDCVPGDKFNITTEQMLRFAPMVAPIMHKVDITVHFFFVPNRILWPNWEKFITGGNGTETLPSPPVLDFNVSQAAEGSLGDYLGLPTGGIIQDVSALPFAAYLKIYNDYYRDQNLIPDLPVTLVDGDNSSNGSLYALRKRAWEHDYFTSALPFAQKGPAVTMPLGTTAPLIYNDEFNTAVWNGSGGPVAATQNLQAQGSTFEPTNLIDAAGNARRIDVSLSHEVDLSDATAATVNDLRRAFRLQEWLEKNARGGTRYIEQMLVHFGVKSSDARLQRPEYLGGNKNPVVISEVLQTAEGVDTPQGNMAGHGIGIGQSKAITYRCEEHGYIMGIMSVMPKTAYQQGIPKHFLRKSRTEYYWPTFAHLGEQPILNKELYNNEADGLNNGVFGYTPRYSEYKYVNSRVAGDFRSDLSFWHMGRIFSTRPALNANFITSNPTHRIFAVEEPTDQKIWAHVYNRVRAVRKMPLFGTPTI